jgi:dihydrofolate reductase
MPRLVVTSFVTVDGIMQAPGGPQEDRSGGFLHGGWVMPLFDDALGAFMTGVFDRAGAFLLGRGTYDIFASYWPKVTDPADPIASRLNRLPKYVASRTLTRSDWGGTIFVRDVPPEVERLKRGDLPGELQVHGSPGLIQTLLAYELVDELNLIQFPVVLGTGKRLFGPGAVPTAFQLVASRATPKGVVISTLRPSGRPAAGDATVEDPRKSR